MGKGEKSLTVTSSPVVLYCVADHRNCGIKRFEVMYSALRTKIFIEIGWGFLGLAFFLFLFFF